MPRQLHTLLGLLQHSLSYGAHSLLLLLLQEIVRLLQTSDALDAETIPLELQNFDFVPYLLSAVPIAGPIMGVQLVHEVGHRVAARLKGVSPCSLLTCPCSRWC